MCGNFLTRAMACVAPTGVQGKGRGHCLMPAMSLQYAIVVPLPLKGIAGFTRLQHAFYLSWNEHQTSPGKTVLSDEHVCMPYSP